MDIMNLLAARKDGVKVELVDGELQIEAPRSRKHCLAQLKTHKAAILAHVNGDPIGPDHNLPVQLTRYQPFPVHTLPGPVGAFVVAAAAAIGCDPMFIALPLLACLARAIGQQDPHTANADLDGTGNYLGGSRRQERDA